MDQNEAVKLIKRYSNRKLYDTEESSYVTLKQISEFVKSGRQVRVVDNTTNENITGQTLLRAIVETETDLNSTNVAAEIIRAGGLGKYVESLKNWTAENL